MKNVKLLSMNLENFKGVKNFSLVTNGESVSVFGDNATGKTTMFDAFLWLLFDKDSQNKKDFEIKALDAAGEEVHNLNHIVEAIFVIDGTEVTLKKVHFEDWVQKRGAANKEFSGHKTKYYIDEVPKKKKEYVDFVAGIVEEELFKLITSPTYFNEQIKWQDRRKLLIDICGDISDEDVFASDNQLKGLELILKGRSLEDHRKVVAERRKIINEDLRMIPVRIDEVNKSFPEGSIDVEAVRGELADIETQIDANKTLINNIQNGQALQSKELELKKVENDLETVKRAFESDTRDQIYKLKARLQEEQGNVQILKRDYDDKDAAIRRVKREDDLLSEERNMLLADWNGWQTPPDFNHIDCECPTCGQELPSDQVKAARNKATEDYNLRKSKALESIDKRGQEIKARRETIIEEIRQYDTQIEKNNEKLDEKQVVIEKLEGQLKSLEMNVKDVSESPEYIKFMNLRQALEQEIALIKNQSVQATEDIKNANLQLEAKKREINAEIAKFANVDNLEARIKEYEDKEEALTKEYQKLEHQVFLTEEFIRRKIELLTEKINSKFKLARFKLFDNQINGGLNEVCETTYNGVPYSSLNNAMRINVGLDIIETLSNHFGIVAPIFVDNAEAVTKLNAIDAQIISLVVSEEDKTLRVEGI
ncbi:AAA family ATPase [Psychrobacillus sp. FSL K6-2365]|uniref:AAA family ATPase n=1 Tax=Psychrobacillus sp. FSL K6-2365 TaxID=2921546 RepID=UPI0030FD073E